MRGSERHCGLQEFCAGGSLASFLREGHARSPETGLNWSRALILMRDVAAGMAYVHKQGVGAASMLARSLMYVR